jgi:hypothetical protein
MILCLKISYILVCWLAGWLLEARGRRSWWCWLLLDWLAGVELHFASRTKSDRLTDDDNDVLMMNDACN